MALGGRETSISDAGRRQKRWGRAATGRRGAYKGGWRAGEEGVEIMICYKDQKKKHILPLEQRDKNEIRAERQETSTCLFWRLRLIAEPKSCDLSGGGSLSSLQTLSHPRPDQHSASLLHSPVLSSLSPSLSSQALETERSECEPPIVEINGIWSARL